MTVRQSMGVLCALGFILASSGVDPASGESQGGMRRTAATPKANVGNRATTTRTIWNPVKNLDVGVEVMYGRKKRPGADTQGGR